MTTSCIITVDDRLVVNEKPALWAVLEGAEGDVLVAEAATPEALLWRDSTGLTKIDVS